MKKVFTLLMFLFVCGSRQAQDFIEDMAEDKIKVSSKLKTKIEKLRKNSDYKSINYVKVNNLKKIQKGGKITIKLPNMKHKVELITLRNEYKSDNDYTWYGTTEDGMSSIVINHKGEEYSGYFSLGEIGEYQLYCVEKQHIITQIEKVDDFSHNCGTINNEEKTEIKSIISNQRVLPCFDPTRVLILWTDNAENTTINMNNLANNCINQFNNTTWRSNIGYVSIVLAGSQKTNFVESNDPYIDLNLIKIIPKFKI